MAGGAVPTLWWFDRFDDRIGVLPVAGVLVHTEEVSGEDTIEFTSWEVPTKGDRLVWLDPDGETWREHVVVRTDEPLEGPCSVYAESSLCELLCDFIEEQYLVNVDAETALEAVLAPTRWQVGDVDDLGEQYVVLYRTSALAALRKVESAYGGEALATIEVEDGRVSSRTVSLLSQVGEWRGQRLTYRKNLAGCTRTVLSEDVYTALYGYGAGIALVDEETGEYTGGYSRKISFADVNDGVAWVGDEDARLVWGRWDADRAEKVHSFGMVVFSECEDPETLLELTREALVDACQPHVSYEVDAALLTGSEVGLGDTVAIVDASRDPEWRLTERVARRVRTFGDGVECALTIGEVQATDYSQASYVAASVADLEDDVESVEAQVASAATVEYVTTVVTETIDLLDLSEVQF